MTSNEQVKELFDQNWRQKNIKTLRNFTKVSGQAFLRSFLP
jgi:hypothetical protein